MVREIGNRLADAAPEVEEGMSVYDEIALELARSEREALAKVHKRITEQQLGEAFVASPVDCSTGNNPKLQPSASERANHNR
jgi:hypothetical protein